MLLKSFTISPSATHVGFLTYGRDAKIAFKLGSLLTYANADKAINDVTLGNPGYNLIALLKKSRNQFFTQNFGGRPGIAKSLFIFNNGKSGILSDDVQYEADKLRELGVKIVVLGVSSNIDANELRLISTNRDSYFFAKDLPNIDQHLNQIVYQLQPGRN